MLRTAQRIHAGVIVGLLIATISPLVSLIPQDTLPKLLRMYLVPDGNYFAYFPWASFVAFGVSAGSILRLVKEDQMHRVMQWAAILGFGLIISGQYFSNLPYSLYPAVDFWINSPGLIFIKLGVILVLLALTFLWTHHGAGHGWSWVRQLGTTSLLVYWVHIELVYGRWFGFWKENLTIAQCALAAITLIVAMIGLSYVRTNWQLPALRLGDVLPGTAPRFGRLKYYMRFLVVEDEQRIADFLKRGLESAGYAVDTAADGKSAIELVHATDYDLIILDMMLPDMDGLRVLERVRNRQDQPAGPDTQRPRNG